MVDVGGPGRSPPALPPLVLLEMSSGCQPSSGITAPCRGTKARVFPLLAWDLSGPSCCRTPLVELSGPSLSLHYSQASHLAQSCLPPLPSLPQVLILEAQGGVQGTPDGMGVKTKRGGWTEWPLRHPESVMLSLHLTALVSLGCPLRWQIPESSLGPSWTHRTRLSGLHWEIAPGSDF